MITDRIIPRLYYIFTILSFFRKIDNKADVLFHIKDLLLGRGEIKIILGKRRHFRVRDFYDVLALQEVFEGSVYLPIFKKLRKDTTLIDIGGYIGDVVVYAQQFKEIKKIITVEPLPVNINLLEYNLKINCVKNAVLIDAAVSNNSGQKKLYIHPNRGQSGFFRYSKNVTPIQVKTVTLEKILASVTAGHLILKCDAEGAEYEIFLNSPVKLLSKFYRIIFEYHDDRKLVTIKAYLGKAGFSVETQKHPVEPNLGIAFAHHL